MSRRYIDPDLWVKAFECKWYSKLVACYLQSHSPNPGGIFRIRPEQIAMETGLKLGDVLKSLNELNKAKYVLWDKAETMVYLVGFAQVQGINPSTARAVNAELLRIGPSPLAAQASQIPQLKHQDPEGYDRLLAGWGHPIDTLLSVCLSEEEGESEGEKRFKVKPSARKESRYVKLVLDAMRDEWPRGEDGRLYRFDRGKARTELNKIPAADFPTREIVIDGVRRWKRAWDSNGFQHKASTFIVDRLWEQSPTGKPKRAQQITAKSLIKEDG